MVDKTILVDSTCETRHIIQIQRGFASPLVAQN